MSFPSKGSAGHVRLDSVNRDEISFRETERTFSGNLCFSLDARQKRSGMTDRLNRDMIAIRLNDYNIRMHSVFAFW